MTPKYLKNFLEKVKIEAKLIIKIKGTRNITCLISSYKCTRLKIKIKIILSNEANIDPKIIAFFLN